MRKLSDCAETALGNLAPIVYRTALMSHLAWRWPQGLHRQMSQVYFDGLHHRGVEMLRAWADDAYEEFLAHFA